MRIMGVDAGKSTGIAVLDINRNNIDTRLQCQFIGTHGVAAKKIRNAVSIWGPDVVVIEQFDLRPGNKFVADLSTVYINGAIEYMVEVGQMPEVVWQTPGQAKGLVNDQTLKNLELWPTGKTVGQPDADDVRDALRHIMYYATVVLKSRFVVEKGWPDK